jgi:hypothetical protein
MSSPNGPELSEDPRDASSGLKTRSEAVTGHDMVLPDTSERSASTDEWLIQPGPCSPRGCLVSVRSATSCEIIAPPGVALELPEPARGLARWRFVRLENGRPVTHSTQLPLRDVLRMVPDRRAWIIDVALTREQTERRFGYQPLEPVAAVLESERADLDLARVPSTDLMRAEPINPRPASGLGALERTKSASAFSQFIRESSPGSTLAQVEHFINDAERQRRDLVASFHTFRAKLTTIREDVGDAEVRDALVALLHARSRSHSWRYTRGLPSKPFVLSVDPHDPHLALLWHMRRTIDSAETGPEANKALAAIRSEWPQLDDVLEQLLFDRAQSLRWRVTRWLRMVLGLRQFMPLRTALREYVRPRLRPWLPASDQTPPSARSTFGARRAS